MQALLKQMRAMHETHNKQTLKYELLVSVEVCVEVRVKVEMA